MDVQSFWRHWQVREDPFRAEEARDDPVFARLAMDHIAHPDFQKVHGDPTRPAAAVVFGEKGSGKTAMRLLMQRQLDQHNAANATGRAWVVSYDDMNGVLDRLAERCKAARDDDALLRQVQLPDHQDAILSLAVTKLITQLLDEPDTLGPQARKVARRMPTAQRIDLATLAALYDQPLTGGVTQRWKRLLRTLRLAAVRPAELAKNLGLCLGIAACGMYMVYWHRGEESQIQMAWILMIVAAAVLLELYWFVRTTRVWMLARRVHASIRTVHRTLPQLHTALADLPLREVNAQPLPITHGSDARYQLTVRLGNVLQAFGYGSMIVFVDRIDEPVRVHGDAGRMRDLVWPMLDNKFLQQERMGMKLLLPIELRHLLLREDERFYQQARLDKQHMVDRLVWSGAMLYDLCAKRLNACREPGAEVTEAMSLMDMFEEGVSRQDLIDALDQMQQPRDAMKFLYRVVQEHCSNVSAEQPSYRIPALVLAGVRKQQAQRVQELHRGLSPA